MSTSIPQFISCGMYAFTENLCRAWQALFSEFTQLYSSDRTIDPNIKFDSDLDVLRDPQLFLGHTCGYPLMQFLQPQMVPVCVPVFDVEGCDNQFYSSQLIVPADSDIQSLSDCQHRIVVINNEDSNSGMNVLRHALAHLKPHDAFFSRVLFSGSHYQSMLDVADSKAQLAAIDCVSFALINHEWPELTSRVRSIGFTAKTPGLPFVAAVSSFETIQSNLLVEALNLALGNISSEYRQLLKLREFRSIELSDYQIILDLEIEAQQSGYPVIC